MSAPAPFPVTQHFFLLSLRVLQTGALFFDSLVSPRRSFFDFCRFPRRTLVSFGSRFGTPLPFRPQARSFNLFLSADFAADHVPLTLPFPCNLSTAFAP